MVEPDDLWYKDAIFYEAPVKSFMDSNGDGIGDFAGMIEKLDYIRDLGVDCIWLLPMYPSPLQDDGYDIADFIEHPHRLRHARATSKISSMPRTSKGLRVIADLVDEPHLGPARVVPGGATAIRTHRSGTTTSGPTTHHSTRRPASSSPIPRSRTGPSIRWRVSTSGTASFSHQPDLNYDNPGVQEEMFEDRPLLARSRARRFSLRRRALPLRARGHQLREPAGDPRVPARAPQGGRRTSIPAESCWPKPTNGPRT